MVWDFIIVAELRLANSTPKQIISCLRKKEIKNEFLEFQQLHKRLAYVKMPDESPRECSTINQTAIWCHFCQYKNGASPLAPLTGSCGRRSKCAPLLSRLQIACSRHFLYTPGENHCSRELVSKWLFLGGGPQLG